MSARGKESRINSLELQLEEAIQMLRLVADEKRTCLEVKEWLYQNYPDETATIDMTSELIKDLGMRKNS